MSPRALIVGIAGQDGTYLAEFLKEKGYEVHGTRRNYPLLARTEDKVPYTTHFADLTDSNSLLRVLGDTQPDEIYNLGAQSDVRLSFDMPESTGDITGLGATRLLEALRTTGRKAKFYQASSSELFGRVEITPQNEETPFHPRNPYACAKAYAFHLTRNYRESYGIYAVNGILFNHESPRRGENYVTRKITSSLARILAGKQDCLYLGNLDARRDWGYASEFVEGIWKMLQQPEPEDYVLATGKQHSVREFLELCLKRAGVKWTKEGKGANEVFKNAKGKTIVAIDPAYKRTAEVDTLVGDATKAKKKLGWEAKTTLEDLAAIMMEADCEKAGVQI